MIHQTVSTTIYVQNLLQILIRRRKIFHVAFFASTAQKMKFSIIHFFSKCDRIRRKLWIWSHLVKISLTENFNFYAVLGILIFPQKSRRSLIQSLQICCFDQGNMDIYTHYNSCLHEFKVLTDIVFSTFFVHSL